MTLSRRIAHLEQIPTLQAVPETEADRLTRRFEEVFHLVPRAERRLLLDIMRKTPGIDTRSPAHMTAVEQLTVLLETGSWPT